MVKVTYEPKRITIDALDLLAADWTYAKDLMNDDPVQSARVLDDLRRVFGGNNLLITDFVGQALVGDLLCIGGGLEKGIDKTRREVYVRTDAYKAVTGKEY